MKWFYDLKIRTKLWVSFLLVALIAGYTGYYVGMGIVLAIGIALAIFLGFLIDRVISNPVKKLAEAADKIALGDVDQKIAIDAKDEIGNLASSFGKIVDSQKELIQAAIRIAAGDTSVKVEARSDKDALSKSFQQLLQTMQGLIAETSQLVQWAKDGQLDKRSDPAKFQGGYATLIRGINETLDAVMAPINEAAGVLEKVAARDLTAQVKGDYKGDHAKIKDALNTAVQNLNEGLLQVAVGAEQVASASSQISSGSQSLAHSTSEQAASLEEVSSSLQEMTSMTKQNAANAKKARRLSEGARASAEKGMGSMQCLSQAMDKIKASSGETAKIVKTIDEIAFQTNLLALNAAVEAARAGDAGRGFAVVAEEVRNLAMRSAEAAKNTANMIEESIKNAENGVALNHEVLKNFADIHHQVNKVSEVMVEIAAASDQQSQGIDQIDTAVEQLNQTTQQTAANAEESASAAEDLSEQAEMMRNMVAGFKLSNAGSSATGLIPRPATHPRRAPTPQPKKPERTPASMWATRKDSNGHACPEDPKLLVPFQDDDETVLQEF